MSKNPTTLPQVSGREARGSALLCPDFGVSIAYLLPEVSVKAKELNEWEIRTTLLWVRLLCGPYYLYDLV